MNGVVKRYCSEGGVAVCGRRPGRLCKVMQHLIKVLPNNLAFIFLCREGIAYYGALLCFQRLTRITGGCVYYRNSAAPRVTVHNQDGKGALTLTVHHGAWRHHTVCFKLTAIQACLLLDLNITLLV